MSTNEATTGARGPSTSGRPPSDEIDVGSLSQDKIKMLMKSDPKFITRLIGQLDKQMHDMVLQKKRRQEQIAADEAEIAKLNHVIDTSIKPNLARLNAAIAQKTALRDQLRSQLTKETKNLKDMQAEASALIQSVRTRTTKLQRQTASQRLEEARGFSSKADSTPRKTAKSPKT